MKPHQLINKVKKNLKKGDPYSQINIKQFGEFEMVYRKDTADEATLNHSFDNDIFFPGVPNYKPNPNHIIIDIGSHIGTFSILAASKVKKGKVYSIEACEDSYNLLRINKALNNCSNIETFHLALSDREGTTKLYYDKGNWGNSTVKRFSDKGEQVQTKTLSNFFKENNIKRCDFMKLNCEGAEFPILLTTLREDLQKINTLLILYHCDLWTRSSEKDLISHLERNGFKCTITNQKPKRGWIIAQRR